jgi:hypothetical protein
VCLVSSFVLLLQQVSGVMTAPTWNSFEALMVGWVFARRRTVTGMIEAAGLIGKRHHSVFHRVFATARWSLDRMGLAVFDVLYQGCGATVFLAVDDTLAHKRGLKMFGTGMHYDPMLSSRGVKVTRWAHSWVVLGVIVRFPLWPDRPFCLPVLFRLYLNKKSAAKHRRVYRTRPQLAVEMLQMLCRHKAQAAFHLLADSAYGGESVLANLPDNCDLTSRLLLNARLHEAPEERRPGQLGRTRKRGQRLPNPAAMLDQRGRRVTADLYGRKTRMRIVDRVARVFKVPGRDLRVVATEALAGGRGREVFYSTCHAADAMTILQWYSQRWSIEVTFRECKQHLGFQEPQGWSRRAVERTAPVAMLLYSLIVYWFATSGHEQFQRRERPWYTRERHASFQEMLATLRSESQQQYLSQLSLPAPDLQKLKQTIQTLALLNI